MSGQPETTPATSDRERSLIKRLQGAGRPEDTDTPIPAGQAVSGTGINLIAAAIAANVPFSFADPANAEDKSAGDRRGDGTVSTDSAEGGRVETEGAQNGAQSTEGQAGANSGSDAAQAPTDDNKSAEKFAPGDAGTGQAQVPPVAPDDQAKAHAAVKHHGSSTSPNLIGLGPLGESSAASAALGAANSGFPAVVVAEAVTDTSGATTFTVGGDSNQFFSVIGAVESASTSTVDFTPVKLSAPPAHAVKIVPDQHTSTDTTTRGTDTAPASLKLHNEETGNGVYVDLGRPIETIQTDHGAVTVNATTLDADGTVGKALAHIEHVDKVVGTVGNDIIVGKDRKSVV